METWQSGWTQISYNGIVGWVNSSYVSLYPTKEVTVDVDGDSLEGIWLNGFWHYLIFNNGKYVAEADTSQGGTLYGSYYLEGDEIIFTVNSYDWPEDLPAPSARERYRIDKYTKK